MHRFQGWKIYAEPQYHADTLKTRFQGASRRRITAPGKDALDCRWHRGAMAPRRPAQAPLLSQAAHSPGFRLIGVTGLLKSLISLPRGSQDAACADSDSRPHKMDL